MGEVWILRLRLDKQKVVTGEAGGVIEQIRNNINIFTIDYNYN